VRERNQAFIAEHAAPEDVTQFRNYDVPEGAS